MPEALLTITNYYIGTARTSAKRRPAIWLTFAPLKPFAPRAPILFPLALHRRVFDLEPVDHPDRAVREPSRFDTTPSQPFIKMVLV
jgi:hypothetical protein